MKTQASYQQHYRNLGQLNSSFNRAKIKAVEVFQSAVASGKIAVDQPGLETIFLADLYRRAGNFEMAQTILERSKTQGELESSLATLFDSVQDLIQAQDKTRRPTLISA